MLVSLNNDEVSHGMHWSDLFVISITTGINILLGHFRIIADEILLICRHEVHILQPNHRLDLHELSSRF